MTPSGNKSAMKTPNTAKIGKKVDISKPATPASTAKVCFSFGFKRFLNFIGNSVWGFVFHFK